jgi:hypothetical protein
MCWGHANLLCIVSLLTICPEAKDGSSIAAIKMEFGRKANCRVARRLCRMARLRRVTCGGVDLDFGKISLHLSTARIFRHYRTKKPPISSSRCQRSDQHHRYW